VCEEEIKNKSATCVALYEAVKIQTIVTATQVRMLADSPSRSPLVGLSQPCFDPDINISIKRGMEVIWPAKRVMIGTPAELLAFSME